MFKYGRPSFTFSKVLNMWKSISFDNTWINMFLAWGRQIAYEKNEISKKNEI